MANYCPEVARLQNERYWRNDGSWDDKKEEKEAESLKKDSCCCGATKSNPCACMIQGIMECSATCPCSLEKKAESIQFNAYTDPISDRQKWLIKKEGGDYSNDWTRSEASKYIKELLNAKPKPKPKAKPKASFRNPLSIMPTTIDNAVGVMFNKDNNEVIGAVAHSPTHKWQNVGRYGQREDVKVSSKNLTYLLLAGDARKGVKKQLKLIDPYHSNLWFAWKQEPLITLENDIFKVAVGDIINYTFASLNIQGSPYKQLNIPSKPTTKDDTYKTIGEIKKLKEDIKLGDYLFDIKGLKKAVSKIPAKDTFESYFNAKGQWVLDGADWTLYLAGRKI